jgi:WD40 repeat protein
VKSKSTRSIQFKKHWRGNLTDYVTDLVWSADGCWLASASAAGEVMLHKLSDDQTLPLQASTGQSVNRLAFSADQRWLASCGQAGTVQVWDMTTTPDSCPPCSQHHASAWIDQMAWHPREPWLAYAVGSQVHIWDVPQNSHIAELDFQNSSVLHLAWHPQGDRLAVSGHGGVKVWSSGNWQTEPTLIAVPGASLSNAWSADGRYLGSGNLDRTLTVAEWDAPPPWLMQGFPGKVRQVAWSPLDTKSGSPLIAAACVEGVTLWERDPKPGGKWQSKILQYHRDRVNAIAFQPGSLLLASAGEDGYIALWDRQSTPVQTLKFSEKGCSVLSWCPAAPLLAVGGTSGTIQVWRLESRSKGFG